MVCYYFAGVITGTCRTKHITILTTCAYFCIGASVTWLACGNYRRVLSLVSSLLTTHRTGPKRGKIGRLSNRRHSRRFAWDGASENGPITRLLNLSSHPTGTFGFSGVHVICQWCWNACPGVCMLSLEARSFAEYSLRRRRVFPGLRSVSPWIGYCIRCLYNQWVISGERAGIVRIGRTV